MVRIGLVLGFQNPPQWRRPWTDVYEDSLELATAGESMGLDDVWLTEHHFTRDGYCPALIPTATALAARTGRIRIGTKVLLLPFHDPVRLAEDIAVADVISGGRIDVGLAAGYRVSEFEAFGVDRSERAGRMEEGLEILQRALGRGDIAFDGRHYAYGSGTISPPPVQDPVPLWLGGRSEPAIDRAARFGCHFQLADFDLARARRDFASWKEATARHGLDWRELGLAAVASIFVWPDPEGAWEIAAPHVLYQQNQYERWFAEAEGRPAPMPISSSRELDDSSCIVGTPDHVAEQIVAFYNEIPFTHFSFWLLLPGMERAVAQTSLELFLTEVAPELRRLD